MGGAFHELISGLKQCRNIRVIVLDDCHLDEEAIRALAAVLPVWKSLVLLSLESTPGIGEGIHELLPILTQCEELQGVWLSACNIHENMYAEGGKSETRTQDVLYVIILVRE